MRFFPYFNPRTAAKWEGIRAKGRLRFILLRGVLGWGLTSGLLTLLIHYFFFHETMQHAVINLVVFLFVGIFFGYQMWIYCENGYKRYLSQQELQALDRLSAKS